MANSASREQMGDESRLAAKGEREVPLRGTPGRRPAFAWAVVAVMGMSLVVRLMYDMATSAVPSIRHLVGDAAGYYEWALRIAGGEWIGSEAFYQAPLYPYVLAVLFKVFGASIWLIRVEQACWGALGVGLLCVATRLMFGKRAGIVAGLLLALFGPAIFFDGIVQKASLGCVLTCGIVAGLAFAEAGGRRWRIGVVGLMAGLLVLTRENALVWIPLLLVWSWWTCRSGGRRACLAGMAVCALGVGVALGPVSVRNWAVSGEWSVSTFQAGPNFYIGNHVGASGLYEPMVRGHETPTFERRDATALAEGALGRELTSREVSSYWMSRALNDIKGDAWGWLRLLGRKMLLVWNRYEITDAESYYIHADYWAPMRLIGGVWHFGVLCPLAAAGIVATRREWRRLWIHYVLIASMAMSVALFYVTARYRFPLVPLLIPFAACGVVSSWDSLRLGCYGRLIMPGAIAAVVAVVVNVRVLDEDRLDAMSQMNMGVALAEDGDLVAATGYFQRAVEGHAESAEANNNLAQALSIQGEYMEAIPYYQTALAADATLIGVAYNLGVALEHVGRLDEALVQFKRAVELDPLDAEAQEAAARLRRTAGQ